MKKNNFLNAAFFKEVFFNVGKIEIQDIDFLAKISEKNLQEQFLQLKNEVIFYRIASYLIRIVPLIMSIAIAINLSKNNVREFILFNFIATITNAISFFFGNLSQDRIMFFKGFIVNTIKIYLNKRNCNPKILNFKAIEEGLIKVCNLERFPHFWVFLILQGLVDVFVLNKIFEINIVICFLTIFSIFVSVTCTVLIMSNLYSKYYEDIDYSRSVDLNIKSCAILEYPESFKLKKYKNVLILLNLDKVIINSLEAILLLFFTFLIIKFDHLIITLGLILLFLSFLENYDRIIFYIGDSLSQTVSFKINILQKAFDTIKTDVPSPFNQPGKINKKLIKEIRSIFIRNAKFYGKIDKKLLLDIKELKIPIKKGLYVVTGDSGIGKSIFLSVLANENFPTEGEIFLETNKGLISYNDFGYWNIANLINYVFITEKELKETTAVKLFRSRLLLTESSKYFQKLLKKHFSDEILKRIQLEKDFLLNSLVDAESELEKEIDKKLAKFLNEFFINSQLFRKDELHITNLQFESLSSGQQSRLLNSYFLTSNKMVTIVDEGLERTTKTFGKTNCVFTRKRLINFISEIAKSDEKTILLLIQGGDGELSEIKNACGGSFLGNIFVNEKNVKLL